MVTLSPVRRLLLAAWLGILAWPYAAASGVAHPYAVMLLPILLAAFSESGRVRYLLYLLSVVATLWLLVLPSPLHLAAAQSLLSRPEAAQRLILAGFLAVTVLLGWQVYRQADSGPRTFLLLLLGAVMLVLDERVWGLGTTLSLLAYLAVGLLAMAVPIAQGRPPREVLGLLAVALLLMAPPLGAAFTAARLAPHTPGDTYPGTGTASTGAEGSVPQRYRAATGSGESGVPGPGPVSLNQSVQLSPAPLESILGAPEGVYWTVAVYNDFNGTSWLPPAGPMVPVPVGRYGSSPFTPSFHGVPTGTYGITVASPAGNTGDALLYTGDPLAVLVSNGKGPLYAYPASRTLRQAGATAWEMQVEIPYFPPSALRRAPWSVAPQSLRADLEVPGDLAPGIRRIARALRAGASGPWDLATRVRQYLLRHETYSTDFPLAANGNVLSDFLLRSHRGYCDQFSTAFIVLLRLAGVPARWVVGYGPGTYSTATHTTLLRAEDAHSWAEVYLAPYGWVPIDPTPPSLVPAPAPAPSAKAGGLREPWLLGAILVLLVLFIGQYWRRRPSPDEALAGGLLRDFDRTLHRRPTQTLRDAAAALPEAHRARIWPIVVQLEHWLYAGRPPSPREIEEGTRALRELRGKLRHRA